MPGDGIVVVVKGSANAMAAPKLMTVDEYLRTPETVLPAELRFGALRVAEAPSARHQARGKRRAWPRSSVGARDERLFDPTARLWIRPARRQVDQWRLILSVGHSHQIGTRPALHDGRLTGFVDSSRTMSWSGAPLSSRRS